jgi:glycosyltransferase involved in cell wall biosynthesis
MKILHVIADLDPSKGGPPAACRGAARVMARRGHEVRIVTTERGFVSAAGDGIKNLEIEALRASKPDFFGTSWAMRRRLRELIPDADVVHLHSLYLFHDWAAGQLCRRFDKPYIVRPHGSLDPYIYRQRRWRKAVLEAAFQNAILRDAAGLHYTTQEEWDLARPFAGNPRGCVIYNGIDLDDYRPASRAALRARFPQIGPGKVVLFLGRLSPKKGLDILIDAFAEVVRLHPALRLVMAGPDEGMKPMLLDRMKQLGITESCVFTGLVAGEDKQALLYGSDIFVLPSLSENFAITVVEAAVCGLPIIMSDRVNLWHEFDAANAASIVPPTAEAVARSLAQLVDDPASAAAMAARGSVLARQHFTWEGLGDQYEQMYTMAAQTGRLPLAREPWVAAFPDENARDFNSIESTPPPENVLPKRL